MARTGRPPTPTEVKVARGTYRKDRHGPRDLAPVLPIRQVSPSAVKALTAVLDAGAAWIGETDGIALTMLAEAIEDRDRARATLREGFDKDLARHVAHLDKHVIALLSVLGFTPADRARLGLTEAKRVTKVEEIRKRNAAGGAP